VLIKPNIKKVTKIINDATDVGASQFKASIREVYGQSEKQQLDHIGSCVFLSINSKKYLLTAAHITDRFEDTPLYIHGAANKLVRIQGEFLSVKKPESGRDADHYDFAWAHLSNQLIELCGENDFIPEEKFTEGTESPKDRIYLALGYPCSKNKPNTHERTITPRYFPYAGVVKSDESLCKELGVLGIDHLFLEYDFKHSKNENADLINSINPRGLSGGALVDMGTFSDWYKSTDKLTGKLAGMLIEMHKAHNVIVAVKISKIVNLIKQEQAKEKDGISGFEV